MCHGVLLSVSQGHGALGRTVTNSACLRSIVTWFLSPEAEPKAPGTEVTQAYGGCQGISPPRAAGFAHPVAGSFSTEPLHRARQALRIVFFLAVSRGVEVLAVTHTSGRADPVHLDPGTL